MQVLIIEDEYLAAEKLESMLQSLDPTIRIAGKLQSVLDSINWLNENPLPDLIFMDIQLDDGVCFEIFEEINIKTPIIFTTAYDSYAIKAFEVNSVDYLLKPIEKEALAKAIIKFRSFFENETGAYTLGHFIDKVAKSYKVRFFVKIGNHFHSIPIDNIDLFFIRERATFLQTSNDRNFCLDYSLDQIQKMVDPAKFFRINRNYLVNINAIQDIYSYSSNRLGLKVKQLNPLDLIVSREKVAGFKKWLDM
jgi:DNA-binding LytR/AlgR family response regulator